ncbi:hypothetical protein SAMN04487996_13816 [Dyadobacter soli]|uniref:Uncharacterized protein n=1 Tax=Dyadobacter soli TaxID=659014 RepID=A0A1G8CJB1_9BACT|nr:hypothetical protein SAMN04487996_13816 [Dyadobacter soli]
MFSKMQYCSGFYYCSLEDSSRYFYAVAMNYITRTSLQALMQQIAKTTNASILIFGQLKGNYF